MAGVLLPFLKWFNGKSGSKDPRVLNFLVRSPWDTIDSIGEACIWIHGWLVVMAIGAQFRSSWKKSSAEEEWSLYSAGHTKDFALCIQLKRLLFPPTKSIIRSLSASSPMQSLRACGLNVKNEKCKGCSSE
ncbi:hypothetical protein Fot_06981 [Forsythia ovata]|uniref:Uncharacterized protein n=1 Tax=Forsythia ovata TaxID=205694 RepID=A0ABD1WUH5_9LAMI